MTIDSDSGAAPWLRSLSISDARRIARAAGMGWRAAVRLQDAAERSISIEIECRMALISLRRANRACAKVVVRAHSTCTRGADGYIRRCAKRRSQSSA